HDPRGQSLPTPAARFGKQEERPEPLRIVVYRPAVPDSPPVLRRHGVVDVGHPDGAQGDVVPGQTGEEVVGGYAVALRRRIGQAAFFVKPLLEDPDLGVMRMWAFFGLIEPAQKAQPLDPAADEPF